MTMSQEARHCLLVFSSSAKNDDEPRSQLVVVLDCFAFIAEDDNKFFNSLSFSTFFPLGRENDNNKPRLS
jgi:hypothetical protein